MSGCVCRTTAAIWRCWSARYHGEIHRAQELRPATIVKLLEKTDAFRRPDRFELLLDACACDFHGRPGFETRPYEPGVLLRTALAAARAVDAGVIAREQTEATKIAAAVHEARVHAVRHALAP